MDLINFPVYFLHKNSLDCTIECTKVDSLAELRAAMNDVAEIAALGDKFEISERPE